ncbi:MAG: LCP family protein [Clostridia bacterium]|nr:LCP family protein [Clostridia bacterium]
MKNSHTKIVGTAICITLMAVIVIVFAGYLMKNIGFPSSVEENRALYEIADDTDTIYYRGKTYRYNSDLMNVLFLGIDTSDEITLQDMPGLAGQSDCIFILSANRKEETVHLLQISRDTMTEVDLFDVSGNYLTSIQAQIATQYAYGNGEQSSCWAAKKTISELLYSLPIDAYISMNLEGISKMNDAVGGVTLTLTQDATEIDSSFRKGNTVTLNGEQAEAFVRYRDINVSGSNQDRMERQMQYLPALLQAARNAVGSSGDYYKTFYHVLEPYTVTDLSAEQMNQLAAYDFLENEVETVPGTLQAGTEYDEFYVDDNELYALIIDLFYQEVN